MSTTININQNWFFLKEPRDYAEVAGLADTSFTSVDIPHTWNGADGQNGGDNYHRGLCWYRKEFKSPALPENGAAYIEFGAANSVADVYLNGVHLGRHEGGYSAFRFDITNHLDGSGNVLLVGVDNSPIEEIYPLFADFTFYGGIYRDVNLIVTEAVHFDMMDLGSSGVYVSQDSVSTDAATLGIRALVVNSGAAGEVTLQVVLKDAAGSPVADAEFTGVADGRGILETELSVSNPILWDGVKNPHLYDCTVSILVDGSVCDSISIPTGLRFYEFDGDRGFILNGKPVRLNGVSRHQDREAVGNALTQAHQDEDMALIKEVGANSIRLAHYQHNHYFYELCDREGMVIWAEIPYISRTSEVEDYSANAKSQMRELIRQNYNHSSILLWGIQNEIGIFPDEKPLTEIVSTMHEVAKEEDSTRLTTQAQVMIIKEDDPANFMTDTVAFNQYHGWYVGEISGYDEFIQAFRKANPDKCLGYSEYGAEGILSWHSEDPVVKDYTEEYHALYHEQVMAIFNRYPFLWGHYVWNMFDFGSDMRDEGGVKGRNNKGLVTFDRTVKKDAFYFYKSIWSEEPVLHLASKRFVNRHAETPRFKVYSNRGDVTLSINGREIESQSSDSTVYEFFAALDEGENRVEVKAGALSDSSTFIKVAEADPAYILPEEHQGKNLLDFGGGDNANVQNWFDEALAGDVGELEFPEGFFSIKDKIKTIIKNDEGRALFEEFLPGALEHKKMKLAFNMPLEVVIGFAPAQFPEAMVYQMNKRLNKIAK